MSKFRNKEPRATPKIVTSALPDIIFMLLFFFMVVTVLRQAKMLVRIQVPEATEVQKLRHKSLINHVYIGQPLKKEHGNGAAIQINDAFIQVDEVEGAIRQLVAGKPENQQPMVTTALKVDRDVKMGIVSDVKLELRKAEQLKVSYTAIAKEN